MEIGIIAFGRIGEFIKNQRLTINGISNTDELKIYLETNFPELADMKYTLALDKQVVQTPAALHNDCSVAIMPPFSGG